MTPKAKAKELVKRYTDFNSSTLQMMNGKYSTGIAKQCALIAVDEIIGEYQSMSDMESILVINNEVRFVVHQLVYWMDVKQEIELL